MKDQETPKKNPMTAVILSGGSGHRLWPLSNDKTPKQFLSLYNDMTLFQNTMMRATELEDVNSIAIACHESHLPHISDQLNTINHNAKHIVLEPSQRGTAASIAVSCMTALQYCADSIILVLPSDHIIKNHDIFQKSVRRARMMAEQGHIVTFGIVPQNAHTGYGYIERGDMIADGAYHICAFHEKPGADVAQGYLHSGQHYWNSGMFCMRASVFLEELQKFQPDLVQYAQQAFDQSHRTGNYIHLNRDAFERCANTSIDYAVMEHTDKGVVIETDGEWHDIGNWDSLWQVCDKDENGNVCKGRVLSRDTRSSYIHGQSDKPIITIGVDHLVIVETEDGLIVADKSRAEEVKELVKRLKISTS